MMKLRWHERQQNMFAQGLLNHQVASETDGFYAKSGMDVHGPYETAQEARRACEACELQENN
jgi:hypothetical protein